MLLEPDISREEWINGFNATKSKDQARMSLRHFDDWLATKSIEEKQFFEEMKQHNTTKQAQIIRDITNYWLDVKKLGLSTVPKYRNNLLKWFEENDLTVSISKVQRIAKMPKPLQEMRYTPDANHLYKLVTMQRNLDVATFFITLAATAMRQDELHQVLVKEVDLSDRMIRIPANRTKTRTERVTYFTPEARHYIKKLIKQNDLSEDDRLFSCTIANYHWHIREANKILDKDERFSNGRRKMSLHRLRAYANDCISSAVTERFADVIKGHIAGNRTYDVGNFKKMKKDYSKAVNELTLDKTQQFEELKDSQEVKSGTDSVLIREIEHLKKEMARLQNSEPHTHHTTHNPPPPQD